MCFSAGLEAIGLYYLERRVEADVLATESIALARAVGVPSLVAWALCVKSWTVPPDDFAIRREMLAEALALFGAQPGQMNIEFAYQVLSEVEFGAGNYELSMAYARQGSAPDCRAGGNEGLVMWCLAASAAVAAAADSSARRSASSPAWPRGEATLRLRPNCSVPRKRSSSQSAACRCFKNATFTSARTNC